MTGEAARDGRDTTSTPARIACIYRPTRVDVPAAMDRIRFVRMSQALARRGHEVDVILDIPAPQRLGRRLRAVPVRSVEWGAYDVVKTFFHAGFDALVEAGGANHPFILSKLGSVVGSTPTPGVHFFGEVRERLYETQRLIARHSRWVTILTQPSAELWRREHEGPEVLIVPTGTDARLPPLGADPYRAAGLSGPIVLFAGNLYTAPHQPEVNLIWQDRLNRLGAQLRRRGARLVAMGYGDTSRLDRRAVAHVGPIDQDRYWDWQRHAGAGIVLAHGPVQDNESSKIYYYLRTALPVVCERPVPNAWLVEAMRCGRLVDLDDVTAMADAAAALLRHPPRPRGIRMRMAREHSWDVRAAAYDSVIATALAARRRHCRPARGLAVGAGGSARAGGALRGGRPVGEAPLAVRGDAGPAAGGSPERG